MPTAPGPASDSPSPRSRGPVIDCILSHCDDARHTAVTGGIVPLRIPRCMVTRAIRERRWSAYFPDCPWSFARPESTDKVSSAGARCTRFVHRENYHAVMGTDVDLLKHPVVSAAVGTAAMAV